MIDGARLDRSCAARVLDGNKLIVITCCILFGIVSSCFEASGSKKQLNSELAMLGYSDVLPQIT